MKKNFNEVYEKIHKNSKTELDELRKKNTTDVIMLLLIIGVVAFTTSLIDKALPIIVICMGAIVFITAVARRNNNYRAIYKAKVIKNIVRGYSDNLTYSPVSTISRRDYNYSGFDTNYDDFYTEDEISGKLEDGSIIKMAQISTIVETTTTDSEGNTETTRTETFRGIYGYINIKDVIIPNRIDVTNNSFLKTYDQNRIEVESAEFEKKYDITTINKLNAMQIFTSDLIEKFVTLTAEEKYVLQMRIEGSIIYFRYKCGEVFEPPKLSSGVTFDLLYKYFSIVNFPIEISEQIIENAKAIKGEY